MSLGKFLSWKWKVFKGFFEALANFEPLSNGPLINLKKVDSPAGRIRKICWNGVDFIDRYDNSKRHFYVRTRFQRVCDRMGKASWNSSFCGLVLKTWKFFFEPL